MWFGVMERYTFWVAGAAIALFVRVLACPDVLEVLGSVAVRDDSEADFAHNGALWRCLIVR